MGENICVPLSFFHLGCVDGRVECVDGRVWCIVISAAIFNPEERQREEEVESLLSDMIMFLLWGWLLLDILLLIAVSL